jgi:uncharacterized protein (DUF362 family)
MGNIVSLVRIGSSEKDISSSVSEALNLSGFKSDGKIESVAIKVNLCYYWVATTGYTTDPRIVAAIVDVLRERYGEEVQVNVVEADATAMRTKHSFRMLGYEKLAKRKNVELLNLSSGEIDEKEVSVGGHGIKFRIPRILLKSDLFINVPKLKIMRATGISCAMKNVFGCIASPRKVVYHPLLAKAIVGINKILHPHLTIVDGLVALGRFPVELRLLMAGIDPFSIDWAASKIMGYNPSTIEFLKLAVREKLGNPEGLSLVGEDITSFVKMFPRERLFSSRWWNLQLRLLRTYCRITGDVIPPMLAEEIGF